MKNIKSIYLLAVICFFVLYACGTKQVEKKFFDIPGYFRAQQDSIKSKFSYVYKTTVYNSDTSEQKLSIQDINWDKEFALFIKTDINKPLYVANMYKLDWPIAQVETGGVERNGGYSIIANNNDLDIQSVDIGTSRKGTVSINIKIKKFNLISQTQIQAAYFKDSLYSISGSQKLKGLNEGNYFFIKGEFK